MSLVAWYKLDGNYTDSSGNGFHGTNNGTTFTDGLIGQGALFAGNSINLPNLGIHKSNFTIAAFIKSPGLAPGMTLNGIAYISFGCGMRLGNSGKLMFIIDNGSGIQAYEYNQILTDDKIYHVAVSYDGVNGFMYINGDLKHSFPFVYNNRYAGPAKIGDDPNNTMYKFNGMIDDVRFYDECLSTAQIKELSKAKILHYKFDDFQEPTTNLITGDGYSVAGTGATVTKIGNFEYNVITTTTGVSGINFTQSGGVSGTSNVLANDGLTKTFSGFISGVAGTILCIQVHSFFQYKTLTGSNDYFEFTVSGSGTNLSLAVFTGYGSAPNVATTFTIKNCQLEYKNYATEFVSGIRAGIIHDCSGYENHADLTELTTPKWIQGHIGSGAYKFNQKYINLPNDIGYRSSFTACGWFKADGNGGDTFNILFGGQELEMSIHDSGYLRAGVFAGTRQFHNHGAGLLDGQLHFIAMTYDGSVKKSYIDGVMVGENAVTGTLTYSFANRRIGVFGGATNYYMNGDLDDIRIYATALSGDDILELYQTRAELDNKGNLLVHEISENIAFEEHWDTCPYGMANTTIVSVGSSILKVTSTSNDPMFNMYNLGYFDPNIYKFIQIRYKVSSGASGVEIFFTNSRNASASADQQRNGSIISDGNWNICNIDMSTNPYWNHSDVTGWRYDWVTSSGVTMELDYIRLVKSIDPFEVNSNGLTEAIEFSEVGPTENLALWCPLEDDLEDISGNGYDGIGTNIVFGSDAFKHVIFNGSSSRIDFPYGQGLLPMDGLTISMWVNPYVSTSTIILTSQVGSNQRLYIGIYGGNWDIGVQANTWGTGSVTANLNTWSFVTLSLLQGVAKLHVNNIMIMEKSFTNYSLSNNLTLGTHPGYFFNGEVSEFRVYNRCLSNEEIETLYNMGNPNSETKMEITPHCLYLAGEIVEV